MNNTNYYTRFLNTFVSNRRIELDNLEDDIRKGCDIESIIHDLNVMFENSTLEIQNFNDNPHSDLKQANVIDITDDYNIIEYITPSNVQVIDIEPQVITIELETIDISNELSINFTYPDDFIIEGQKQCDIENYIILCDIPQDPIKISSSIEEIYCDIEKYISSSIEEIYFSISQYISSIEEEIYCDIEKYLTLYIIPQEPKTEKPNKSDKRDYNSDTLYVFPKHKKCFWLISKDKDLDTGCRYKIPNSDILFNISDADIYNFENEYEVGNFLYYNNYHYHVVEELQKIENVSDEKPKEEQVYHNPFTEINNT